MAAVLFSIVAYVVLLVIAAVADSDPGGPLAWPFLMAVAFATSASYTVLLLFPSAVIAEQASHLEGKGRHLAEIPIAALALLLLTYGECLAIRRLPLYSQTADLHWADTPIVVFLGLLIPLGLYWWVMKFVQLGTAIPAALLRRRH